MSRIVSALVSFLETNYFKCMAYIPACFHCLCSTNGRTFPMNNRSRLRTKKVMFQVKQLLSVFVGVATYRTDAVLHCVRACERYVDVLPLKVRFPWHSRKLDT